ncbi:MAG: alpha/beta fold hydrolase [Gemmatimonadota bacterium]
MTTWIVAIAAGVLVLLAIPVAFSARSMVRPGRILPWTTPKEALGLVYEDVSFPAQDGVRLKGWFIPALGEETRPAPVIVMIHGWCWNRLGTRMKSLLNDFPAGKPVELAPMAGSLHAQGYHVLMFDLRNFGESERKGVYTGGWLESRDLLGAVDYLAQRKDVDPRRIGVMGFSVGGNILLFALPHTHKIRAGVAIQPSRVSVFSENFARKDLKGIGWLLNPLINVVYRVWGGPDLRDVDPALAVAGSDPIPVLFMQGTGDRWGTVEDVERMAAATPGGLPTLVVETEHRFDGYNYAVQNPEITLDFFGEHLSDGGTPTSPGPPTPQEAVV